MDDPEVIEALDCPSDTLENDFGLTPKQRKFVDAYIQLNDATKACIVAGYSPKSANVEANRMLKRANVINALADWRKSKRLALTKDSFVDKAMDCFEQLDVTEPNKPRFLDLAGKTLGYIGNVNQSVTNNTLNVTKVEVNTLNAPQKWDALRNLLEAE
jgi:hypothetical protein